MTTNQRIRKIVIGAVLMIVAVWGLPFLSLYVSKNFQDSLAVTVVIIGTIGLLLVVEGWCQ